MGMNTCNDKLVTIGKTRGSVELYHPRLRYPGVGTTQPGLRLKSPKLWQLQAHSSEFLVYKAKDETALWFHPEPLTDCTGGAVTYQRCQLS